MHGNWHHLALSVNDMDAAKRFYCQLLDFEVDWEKENVAGEAFSKIVSLPHAIAQIVMLRGYGVRLELFRYHNPQGSDISPKSQCDCGYTHFALSVTDIWNWYNTLSSSGVVFHCPPQNLRQGVWVTYMNDPEGNTIELVEYLEK